MKKNNVLKLLLALGSVGIFLSSCTAKEEKSYVEENAKYFSALESVIDELEVKSQVRKRNKDVGLSIFKVAIDVLSLPYFFLSNKNIKENDLSLAYSSEAIINEQNYKLITRCKYINNTLGVYTQISINNEISNFYLDGIYDEQNKSMLDYYVFMCNSSNEVNQYVSKISGDLQGFAVRDESFSQFDSRVTNYYSYLNSITPINVDGALLKAYSDMNYGDVNVDDPNEQNPTLEVSIAPESKNNITLKMYNFNGEETNDFSYLTPSTLIEDLTLDNLYSGTAFHSYAMTPGGLIDITNNIKDKNAFIYVRVENQDTFEFSFEASEGINEEMFKYVRFSDGVRLSSPRGDSFFFNPPDNQELKFSSGSTKQTLSGLVNEYIVFIDGELVDDVLPNIDINLK